MTLTIVPRTDADEPLLCPWDDTPLHRVGKVWRCIKHDMTSKVDLEFVPFDGWWVTLARQSRGMSQEELASSLRMSLDTLQAIESGDMRPAHEMQERLGDALDVPVAFFMQARVDIGPTSLEWHEQFDCCECGQVLCHKTQVMPLVCPQCMEPTYGCPHCDGDMHLKERHSKALGYAQMMFICERCDFKANTAEMLDIVKAQIEKEATT